MVHTTSLFAAGAVGKQLKSSTTTASALIASPLFFEIMAFEMSRGKVPHFSMKPHPAVTGAFIMIMIIGILLAMSLFAKDEGTGVYRQQGILVLIITGIICICLIIVATAKFWYTHLWKKNSTHARHKQHTQHHPASREKQYPNQRKRR
jgi:small-conductance mechanosensitive channel